MPRLVLGSHNRKKRAEMAALLAPLGIEIETLADYANALEVDETGSSFAENSALKAVEQAMHLDRWVLAEDSGLVVSALDGAPGIYSARYSGPNATDESNNTRLLEALAGIPEDRRQAHYVCQMTLADPTGTIRAVSEGACHGRIVETPRGTGGFGYDPLFEIIELHRTFGELDASVKAAISHRARASRRLLPQLVKTLNDEAWKPTGA